MEDANLPEGPASNPATGSGIDGLRSPASATQPGAAGGRRGRVALACQRCKRRKQRCDGGQPTCKGCLKADVQCLYERVIRPRYPGGKSLYISALEERIAFLEARMPEEGQDHFEKAPTGTPSPAPEASRPPPRRRSRRQSTDLSEDEDTALVDGVAYLSLCASGATDTTPEPFYLGSSSGATIARMMQSSVFRTSKLSLPNSTTSVQQGVLRPSTTIGLTVPSLEVSPAEFPPRPQAQLLFSVFFDRLHTRWPILDRKQYQQVFDQQYTQGALSLLQRSILHLIYAISSRFLQLMKKQHHVDPQIHFTAAIEPMDSILEQHNLATVQFLVLLAIHGQRSPYGAGSWSQIRYALTTCVELGLHRARASNVSPSQSPRELELRRRVFWACYSLDRATSVLLGRTFGIADRDINVALPSASADFWDLTSAGSPPSEEGERSWSNVAAFIHILKLRKLQSKIHRTVFRVDKDVLASSTAERAKLDKKVTAITAALDDWAARIPSPPRDVKSHAAPSWMHESETTYHHQHHYDSRDFFMLQYHKTVLTLFTALLPILPASDPRFVTGAKSAARVCTAYKRLNQQRTLGYTVAALHGCFVAGLALVYCLWRDAGLFSYQALEAVRACSLCLTVFGEKWPGAARYRDTFDALSASLFKAIVSPKGGGGSGESTPAAAAPAGVQGGGRRKQLEITIQRTQMSSPEASAPYTGAGTDVTREGLNQGNDLGRNMSPGSMVRGAVKEVFMEVDEEAPGGWQGWRMFTEMVQQSGDVAAAQRLVVDAVSLQQTDDTAMRWDEDVQLPDRDYGDGDFQMVNGFTTNDMPQRWN